MKFIKKHPYLFCELLGVIVIVVTILATIIISTDDRTVGNLIENYATYMTIGNYVLCIAVIELIVSPIIIKIVRNKKKKDENKSDSDIEEIESNGVFSRTQKAQIRRKHRRGLLIGITFVILGFVVAIGSAGDRHFFDKLKNEDIGISAYTYVSGQEPELIRNGENKAVEMLYSRFGVRGRAVGKGRRKIYYCDCSYYIKYVDEKIMIILLPTEYERPIYTGRADSTKEVVGITRKIDDELKERIIEASKSNGINLTKEDFGNKVADIYLDTSKEFTTKQNLLIPLGLIIVIAGVLLLIVTIIDIVRVKKLEL